MADRSGKTAWAATGLIVAALCWGFVIRNSGMMTGAMPMPGGWTMGTVWMPMANQSRLGAGAMFATMWLTMMIAMMLPSSLPMLLLYRGVVRFHREPHADALVWIMAAGYFVVWTIFGVTAYVAGSAIAGAAMRSPSVSRAIPLAAATALVIAGGYQLTPWKAACLSHCRDPLSLVSSHVDDGWRGAVALGVHHGLFCTGCCWALMLMQLVIGVMNLGAMAAIAIVIALEKLLAHGPLIARGVGIASLVTGGWWLVATLGAGNW